MGIRINEDNYEKYKEVFSIIWKHQLMSSNPILVDLTFPEAPTEIIKNVESKNKRFAMRGLEASLNDVLSNINHHQKSRLEAIDRDLKEHGYTSLRKLISIKRGMIKRVLKNQKITRLDDYYTIKELLDDTVSEISEVERLNLNVLMGQF